MARRRKLEEEHVNHERWLVSYADFITLLFAFFVVMYSISPVNEGKYRILSDTLEATFTDSVSTLNPIQVGDPSLGVGEKTNENTSSELPKELSDLPSIKVFTPPPVSKETLQTINSISKKLNTSLQKQIKDKDIIIKQGDDWLELEIKSKLLFYSGQSRLGKEAIPIIGKVADILRPTANPIQVEGFTDNKPINTLEFPSNWELSAARAASVVHLLDRYGLKPDRLSAIGYGEFKPIANNETVKGRNDNRRVVLVILGKDYKRRTIDIYTPPTKKRPTQLQTPSNSALSTVP